MRVLVVELYVHVFVVSCLCSSEFNSVMVKCCLMSSDVS